MEKKQLISAYPNPVTDVLNIKVTSGEINKLAIFDLTGKSLYMDYNAKNSTQIDVNWLNNGLYFLKVETKSGTHLLKFIKE